MDVENGMSLILSRSFHPKLCRIQVGDHCSVYRPKRRMNGLCFDYLVAIVEEPIRPALLNVTMLVKTNSRSRQNPPRNKALRLSVSGHLVIPAMAILITISF